MLNVALAKGRLGDVVYSLLDKTGYGSGDHDKGRKLIYSSDNGKINYFWVKPSDVAIYVERGAADVGVVGRDILLETKPDVYELCDLGFGKCKMAVAAKKEFVDNKALTLRVATKFPEIAHDYYTKQGREIEIIKLNGSIELAPLTGFSDVIVDIVETGKTLKENGLEVIADVVDISARFISNKSSFKFKQYEIEDMLNKLKDGIVND